MAARRGGVIGAAAVTAVLALLLFAPGANAFIYWVDSTDEDRPTIARANNDGSGINKDFITGIDDPCGISSDGTHLYWANRGTNSIGRANLDGSGVNPTFIIGAQGPGEAGLPCDPEVGAGGIWWANIAGGGGGGAIGRANLDGSGVDTTRFDSPALADTPISVAIAGDLVFWSNIGFGGAGPSIGRAGAGGNPAPNRDLVTFGSSQIAPFWLDAAGGRLYATLTAGFLAGYAIGSFDLDGDDLIAVHEGTSATGGLAVHGARLFWANSTEGTISTSALDGTNADFAFMRGLGDIRGIEVDGGAPPSNVFEIGKLKRNKSKGTGKLALELPGPGVLSLAGSGLKGQSTNADAAGEVKLAVVAKGRKRRALKRDGKVRVEAEITFLPTGSGAEPRTETKRLKLVRR